MPSLARGMGLEEASSRITMSSSPLVVGSPFVRHQHGQLCLKVKPLQCTVAGFVRGGEDDGLCPRQGVIPCGIPKKRRKRPVLH